MLCARSCASLPACPPCHLCSALLAPQHTDVEGLRYVMWVAEQLQGGRMRRRGRGGAFYRAWEDCRTALRQRRPRTAPLGSGSLLRTSVAGQLLLEPLWSLRSVVTWPMREDSVTQHAELATLATAHSSLE